MSSVIILERLKLLEDQLTLLTVELFGVILETNIAESPIFNVNAVLSRTTNDSDKLEQLSNAPTPIVVTLGIETAVPSTITQSSIVIIF